MFFSFNIQKTASDDNVLCWSLAFFIKKKELTTILRQKAREEKEKESTGLGSQDQIQ